MKSTIFMLSMHTAKQLSLCLILATTAWQGGQAAEAVDRAFFQTLADQNRVSPLEHAGAHGLVGWRVGAGLSSSNMTNESYQILEQELNTTTTTGASPTLIIPKIWFTKGLIYPIDVGLHFATLPGNEATLAGAYLQWTAYEALAQPALALRISRAKTFGLRTTTLSSTSLSAVTSWGFMFFSAYLGFGFHQHDIKTAINSQTSTEPFNKVIGSVSAYKWTETTTTVGTQFQLVPPFLSVALEGTFSDQESTTYQAKLSFGM